MIIKGLLVLSLGLSLGSDAKSLRQKYHEVAIGKSALETLETSCQNQETMNTTDKGYCSMIYFLKAKKAINPYKKWDAFNEGKKKLEMLIYTDSSNIELRYLRHSIQVRVPWFLNYHDQVDVDYAFMKMNLNSCNDTTTYQLIENYLNNTTN